MQNFCLHCSIIVVGLYIDLSRPKGSEHSFQHHYLEIMYIFQ